MMIVDFQVEAYRLPPSTPWEDATNKVAALEFVVVKLQTDVGIEGTGFTYSVDVGGHAIKALVRDYLGRLVIGCDPLRHEFIWNKLQRQSRRLGVGVSSMAIAALDIGVWDIIGKHHRTPLHLLLGGARDRIRTYKSEINLSSADAPELLGERLEGYRSQGYSAAKIKIGHDDPELDVERLRVATSVFPNGQLFVDLNQKWDLGDARRAASWLNTFTLGWVEEPLQYPDVAGHAELRSVLRAPIALGESLHSGHQVLQYLQAGAVDVVQADVAFVGGITEWLRIAHAASLFGKPVAPHYMMELSLPLLCGVQNAFMLEDVVGGDFHGLGLVEHSVEIVDGVATPSDRPGHGIEFIEEALERHLSAPEDLWGTFSGGSR